MWKAIADQGDGEDADGRRCQGRGPSSRAAVTRPCTRSSQRTKTVDTSVLTTLATTAPRTVPTRPSRVLSTVAVAAATAPPMTVG